MNEYSSREKMYQVAVKQTNVTGKEETNGREDKGKDEGGVERKDEGDDTGTGEGIGEVAISELQEEAAGEGLDVPPEDGGNLEDESLEHTHEFFYHATLPQNKNSRRD